MSHGNDPHEALEEILGKKDALNPIKAMEKGKSFLAMFALVLGLAPFLIISFFKIAPIIFVFLGLWLACRGIQMAWNRSRKL